MTGSLPDLYQISNIVKASHLTVYRASIRKAIIQIRNAWLRTPKQQASQPTSQIVLIQTKAEFVLLSFQ